MAVGRRGKITNDFLMKKPLHLFLALAVIEGILSLVWLLAIPSDQKTAWLMGYSRSRLLLVVGNLVGIASFLVLSIKTWRDAVWTGKTLSRIHSVLQNERIRVFIWEVSIVVLTLAVIGLWIVSKDAWTNRVDPTARSTLILMGVYLTRLSPFIVWIAALSIQTMIMLWLLGYTVRLGYLLLQIFSVAIFPSLMLVFASLHLYYYRDITKEDALIEWLTVAVLLLAAVLAIMQAVKARRGANTYFWFYILFAMACVLFALEEISWGQRIFGLESSQYFMEHSDQKEINIHNVINLRYGVRTKHIAAWALLAYGAILPVLVLNRWVRSLTGRLRIIVPPLVLVPGFALAALMTWDRYFTGQDEEAAEFFFALLLLLFMIFNFWESRVDHPSREPL